MGTRLRIVFINLIGGLLACGFMLLLLPAPAMAAETETPKVVNHRDLIFSAPEKPDPTPADDIPEGELPVTAVTLTGSASTHEGTGGIYVLNQTDYEPDYAALLSDGVSLSEVTEGPQVLILHTHGTEAYSPEGTVSYDPESGEASVRSENPDEDVVAVGRVMAEALEKRGIEVVHDETLCDIPSFNQAYVKSLAVAEAELEAYPSVRVVLDIHRDSMITSTGVKYRPITVIGDKTAAQMMLVVGTPQNGKQHDNWRDNLRFAMALQKILVDNYPGLMRPLNLRADRFNQHLRQGAILVEVGSCGNSLGEAEYAAELFAAGLAQLLK
ncbi:MAG TPA: stage II sporulation protein P [Terriglobales bacterium]|nr:stage II sporulation protein P [Terriglobales bacterium]